MDINSRGKYPSSALSNFAPHMFMFGDVECNSMEGLLQSFKFADHDIQKTVCTMTGREAKKFGAKSNWQNDQTLYWKGAVCHRNGPSFRSFLNASFDSLATNEDFVKALLATGHEELTHSIGEKDQSRTILTEEEFCSRLMQIRTRLKSEVSIPWKEGKE